MCSLCFSILSVDEAWVDSTGQKWDNCAPCKDWEDRQMIALGRGDEIWR